MNTKKHYCIANILLIVGLIILIISVFISESLTPVLAIIGLIIGILGFILMFILWRCPNCKSRLPFHGSLGIRTCPYCGKDLD